MHMTSSSLVLTVCFAMLLGACGDDGTPAADSSMPTDSATDDSGSPPDSSTPPDAATDAATDSATDAATDAGPDAATDAATDAAPDAAPDATVDAAVASGCSTDADCRAFSNYCDGCECLALDSSEPDPVCGGTTVLCFVDPCSVVGAVRCNRGSGTCEFRSGPPR